MYMANHDIVLIAHNATPTNWTRHRSPFAPLMSRASGTAHIGRESRSDRQEISATTLRCLDKSLDFPIRHVVTLLYVSDDPLK